VSWRGHPHFRDAVGRTNPRYDAPVFIIGKFLTAIYMWPDLSHCLRLGGRWSASWAIFNHDSAMRSQTALSLGLIAFSACRLHSSAFSRNSSAVLKANP
jgi:hypothetical protein